MKIIETKVFDMNLNRKEKIELLKNIFEGKASIKDLQPKKFYMNITGGGQPNECFINGERFPQEKFDKELLKLPKPINIQFLIDGKPLEDI